MCYNEAVCSIVKKPTILLSNALLFVAFLSYFDIIHVLNAVALAGWVQGLIIFYITWAVSFMAMFHTALKEASHDKSKESEYDKLAFVIRTKMEEIVCWAALFAAASTLAQILEDDVQEMGGLTRAATAWVMACLICFGCFATVVGSKLTNCVLKSVVCFVIIGRCDALCLKGLNHMEDKAARFEDAKQRAADSLHFTLTSALAWVVAVSLNHAVDATIVASVAKNSDAHLGISWGVCVSSCVFVILWLLFHQRMAKNMHKATAVDEAYEKSKEGQKRRRTSIIKYQTKKGYRSLGESLFDMADQV